MNTDAPARGPIGIALVGCGRIAPLHLKGIARLGDWVRLVAVVDPDPALAARVAEEFGAARALATLEDALADPEVEAVVLCTPNALHAQQAMAALRAGRQVLVEKPFSETVEEAQALAALAEETGLVLAAGHTFRHVEAVRQLQDRAASFGRLRAVSISMCVHWDGPQAPWWATRTREEGLILSLFAPHAIDFVQLVVGDVDPVRLHVEAARHQSGWQAEDEAMILMRYPEDVLVSIHVSYNQATTMNRKVVHFENATVRIENGDELWIDDVPVVVPERAPSDDTALFNDGIAHYFETQMREFARAVQGLPNRSVRHDAALRQSRLNHAIIAAARHA
ncbi:Gfo/Idh/MocA family oxidoreductase [Novosphingobium profundi]|uniref:Gfo/Idh/MocA family protein n=1 Tax=Novosphingobium profundi TaxID=1774954 RepID=UPI001BDB2F16|nr:Gfo/Idh/MocA family oxidoreductase [Novosphingobium profundi]MBT0669260.1 Gfo/Idh/MocA family oxidoreductase [Novosphingobium profundi]